MAAVASLVVVVFLTLSAGILHIPVVRDFALERGQGYLLEQQQIDLEAGKLDYNLFAGSSTLHDVVIRSLDAPPDSPPFFTATRVDVKRLRGPAGPHRRRPRPDRLRHGRPFERPERGDRSKRWRERSARGPDPRFPR
jgi:hypothetical protein